jgi:hypothetical protein
MINLSPNQLKVHGGYTLKDTRATLICKLQGNLVTLILMLQDARSERQYELVMFPSFGLPKLKCEIDFLAIMEAAKKARQQGEYSEQMLLTCMIEKKLASIHCWINDRSQSYEFEVLLDIPEGKDLRKILRIVLSDSWWEKLNHFFIPR